MDQRRRRLLLMDEIPERRLGLSSLLSQAGYSVEAVADTGLAVSLAKVRPPDVAVLAMPHGLDVCRALRAERALADTPVVMVTPDNAEAVRIEALSGGADETVSLPLAREAFLDLLAQLLHIRDVARTLDLGAAPVVAALK